LGIHHRFKGGREYESNQEVTLPYTIFRGSAFKKDTRGNNTGYPVQRPTTRWVIRPSTYVRGKATGNVKHTKNKWLLGRRPQNKRSLERRETTRVTEGIVEKRPKTESHPSA